VEEAIFEAKRREREQTQSASRPGSARSGSTKKRGAANTFTYTDIEGKTHSKSWKNITDNDMFLMTPQDREKVNMKRGF
jgi:hypothetical protein